MMRMPDFKDLYKIFWIPTEGDHYVIRIYDNDRFLTEMSDNTRLFGYHTKNNDNPYVDDYAAAATLVLDGYPDKPLLRHRLGTQPYLVNSLFGYVTPQIRNYDINPIWLPLTLCANVRWLLTKEQLINELSSDQEVDGVCEMIAKWMSETIDNGCHIEPQILGEATKECQVYSQVVRFQSLRHMTGFREKFPFPL